MLFTERFKEIVRATPEAMAVIEGGTQVTYRELHDRAQRLARKISDISPGAMIGVLMPKGIDYVTSILAIHLCGRTVVPLESSYPSERFRYIVCAVDLSVCLINQQSDPGLSSVLGEGVLPFDISGVTNGVRVDVSDRIVDVDPAYAVFTSGTTGRPKPVMVPYRSLSTLIDWMVARPRSAGTTLLYAAQGFDVSFQEIYGALCQGHCLLSVTEAQKKDLHLLTDLLHSHAVTRLFLPTSMLIPFVTFNRDACRPFPKLEEILVAGEQLKITQLVRQWFKTHAYCRLINHYGPSETHVVMVHELNNEPETWPDLPPIGQVTPASTAYLLNERLEPVTPGNFGQLYIAGDSLALGYYQMPTETAEKFLTHPHTKERLYNTGDICVVNGQGLYEYRGRSDRQYKVRGYRIELQEIEAAVTDSGLVVDCIAVAKQSGMTTSLLLYFTSPACDQDISSRLHAYLMTRLPEYMLPSFYTKIAEIPLTPNGKVDNAKLPQLSGMRSQRLSRYVSPEGELETLVCGIAASCLGVDRVGACDNFMDAGASSITLISLLAELRYALAHDFRQTDLFEYPTPRQLCIAVQHLTNAESHTDPNYLERSNGRRSGSIQRSQGRQRGY